MANIIEKHVVDCKNEMAVVVNETAVAEEESTTLSFTESGKKAFKMMAAMTHEWIREHLKREEK